VIDGWAVQRASAAAYEAAVFGLAAVLTAPLILKRMPWATALGVCRRRWRRVVVVGGAMAGGYLLVLWAFRLAPIAYVGATREVSIVVAALAGWRVLGERLSVTRLLGAVVIVLGIAAIKWFG
jgi:drug/metabolite transporter (DMT)-like permease